MNKIGNWAHNWLVNLDRTVASLFGAPPEETISSEIGRHDKNPVVEVAADALDAIQKDHVENAQAYATALDKAAAAYYAAGGK